MSIKFLDKPFYFLTDRDTKYLYFIDNSNRSSPTRTLYYPKQFGTMTTPQLQKYKNAIRRKFIFWAIFHPSKLAPADRLICYSKAVDLIGTVLIGMVAARQLRKLFFRMEFPILQTSMENVGLNVRVTKSLFSYGVCVYTTYHFLKKTMNEQHLTDLGF